MSTARAATVAAKTIKICSTKILDKTNDVGRTQDTLGRAVVRDKQACRGAMIRSARHNTIADSNT